MSKQWKCMECESISRYKGLCRDCTEYDGDGNIDEASKSLNARAS